jgi:hypothetical protein
MCSSTSFAPSQGSSGPRSLAPAMRSNMNSSIRAAWGPVWKCRTSAACSWPGRSTAQPAMKKRPPRDSLLVSMPPLALGLEPVRFDRRTSYIGVMVDDLTVQGVTEPYRMMTARAEYRLALRADNATTRLGDAALNAGCVSQLRRRRRSSSHFARARNAGLVGHRRGTCRCSLRALCRAAAAGVGRGRSDSRVWLGGGFDYSAVPGLSNEMVERLSNARPETLDQASRVPGVTPAALSALHVAASRAAA